MISEQASNLGSRLDDDHLPETNGRMAVCRRCGAHTETPEGLKHAPRRTTTHEVERMARHAGPGEPHTALDLRVQGLTEAFGG